MGVGLRFHSDQFSILSVGLCAAAVAMTMRKAFLRIVLGLLAVAVLAPLASAGVTTAYNVSVVAVAPGSTTILLLGTGLLGLGGAIRRRVFRS